MKSINIQGIFGETFVLALSSSAFFRLKNFVSNLFWFVLLVRQKGFYQSSLVNEVDFTDIMNVYPNILVKNLNFKKLRQGFVDERAMITTTL